MKIILLRAFISDFWGSLMLGISIHRNIKKLDHIERMYEIPFKGLWLVLSYVDSNTLKRISNKLSLTDTQKKQLLKYSDHLYT